MQIQYINEMLNIPELTIHKILLMSGDEIHIEVKPLAPKQCCPVCHSDEFVTLKGSNGMCTVRHLPVFEKNVYLLVPSIRMQYSQCHSGFVWVYDFVRAKERYSKLFRERIVEQVLGSTAAHSARMQKTPASTAHRMHNEALPLESERLSERAWKQAIESTGLVLGVDDFAIKKGHTYNTGIHDLRGGTLLDILPGRKLEELRAYTQQHPGFLLLTPKAVVMDLARGYHTWISECFPNAIRITDRFHVQGYIIEAIQEVRKTVERWHHERRPFLRQIVGS